MALQWLMSFTQLISISNNDADDTKPKQNKTAAPVAQTTAKQSPNYRFEMPLHYPRYTKSDYESMEEWKVDALLRQYGLDLYHSGASLDEKRSYAIGTFLWPDQL